MNDRDQENDYEDYSADEVDLQIEEYDIASIPNDFNVLTLYNFIKSGSVIVPGFQRNFVWDLPRASKFIESLIQGLPIPQIFLYEQKRNKLLILDGQQRLMSIYYFIEQRFPKKDKRTELRRILNDEGNIPDDILRNDDYFQTFELRLLESLPGHRNKFKGLKYSTLGEYKKQFKYRPIRTITVKQNAPTNDDSSMYELFNRLNTGGINLCPQEIRTSMYHSDFYDMLNELNAIPGWRKILGKNEPDIHMKDIEILLRGFAFLIEADNYKPSMVKFLNQFSKQRKENTNEDNKYLRGLFNSFLRVCSKKEDIFRKKGRFNFALYEAVFTATCRSAYENGRFLEGNLDTFKIEQLENNEDFRSTIKNATTATSNVNKRLEKAREIISAL